MVMLVVYAMVNHTLQHILLLQLQNYHLHITNVYFNPAEAFSIGSETIFPHTTAPNDSNGFYIVFQPTSNENNIYYAEMTIESNMVADIQISLTGIGRSSDMQVYDRIDFIEDFTAAEWCPYCPVGSLAIRDLTDVIASVETFLRLCICRCSSYSFNS